MTKGEFAQMLNGRKYRNEMSKADNKLAENLGLVVVFGASDDLVKFRGKIDDEFGAWDGTTISIAKTNGKVIEDIDERKLLISHGVQFTAIDVIWSPVKDGEDEPYTSWLIDAEMLETASFDIMEDGELYCRGIVFEYAQLLNEVPRLITWTEQTERYGLDYTSCKGVYEDYVFDIRYDYDGDDTQKPDCGLCMNIYFKDKVIQYIFGADIESLKYFATQFINHLPPSV